MIYIFSVVSLLTSTVNAGTHEAGKKWLEEKSKEPGVIKIGKEGLMYKVLKAGDGIYSPKVNAKCDVHYEGTLIDGTKFDSSYDRGQPTSFAPNQVIKGWTVALQQMVEGDKWELYIPSELGYGDRGSGDKIKGGDPLVFKMEIMKIVDTHLTKRTKKCDFYNQKKEGSSCQEAELKVFNEQVKPLKLEELEKKLEELKKKLDGTLKSEERKTSNELLTILKAAKKHLSPPKEKKEKKKKEKEAEKEDL